MTFLLSALPAFGSFGFQPGSFDNVFVNENNSPAVQAGSHPFAINTTFKFNTTPGSTGELIPDGDVKDVEVALPAGLTGDPTATPKCSIASFNTPNSKLAFGLSGASCPDDSQIGVAQVEITTTGEGEPVPLTLGIYNLVAPPGVPAEFGFSPNSVPVVLVPKVRTGGDYGVTVGSMHTSQAQRVFGVKTTFWGVPAASSHDGERGECLGGLGERFALGVEHPCPVETAQKPFLTLPTSCMPGALATTIRADSWQNPVQSVELEGVSEIAFNHDAKGRPIGLAGCGRLDFSPAVSIASTNRVADSPTGMAVDVTLPQNDNPSGLAEANLKKAVVTLPVDMAISPSAATGREACSEAQIAIHSAAPAACPDASKVGDVEIETPLLEAPLEGSVYLAEQEHNPFGSLFALYVVAEGSGVTVKLAGLVLANPSTGQLSTTFDNSPQQPFSHLKISFFGGPRAALVTPRGCGSYSATGALTPWSTDLSTAFASTFTIYSGCVAGFAPALEAGTVNAQAGGFSPLRLTLSRSDQDQRFRQLSVRTPPGLLGLISKVQPCEEPLVVQQACPTASHIGHVTVVAGPGPNPLSLPQVGGREDPVYLTGPYKNAPFGLLTLVHAEAGPFDLGTVPVRVALNVDRRTSQITATSDTLPTILDGVPVDVRAINVLLDHEGFVFNPTNCRAQRFEGAVLSDEGATASISSRFQAANCASLPFHPTFKVSTAAHPSHAKGASLDVRIGYPHGSQANIAAVRVSLPRQMPSRLTTLQHACPEAMFAANPATCPAESVVGAAIGVTPVLNVPVSGPAYLVSHGGAAFPDLVVVLQGQSVTVELIGGTSISKAGITTSTFSSVPDVPISSFDLKLPQGPHSALTENLPRASKGNFCSSKLFMPTTIFGQNGTRLQQSTKISVTGCSTRKRAKAHAPRRK
ncbi:MAG TPA: hypothetical protein VIC06_02650 [Solirubrobacteraceae bacterium]|jgi:hypothetical protein